eukprot:6197873-Pleurochrysis_carterae.AAC.1
MYLRRACQRPHPLPHASRDPSNVSLHPVKRLPCHSSGAARLRPRSDVNTSASVDVVMKVLEQVSNSHSFADMAAHFCTRAEADARARAHAHPHVQLRTRIRLCSCARASACAAAHTFTHVVANAMWRACASASTACSHTHTYVHTVPHIPATVLVLASVHSCCTQKQSRSARGSTR